VKLALVVLPSTLFPRPNSLTLVSYRLALALNRKLLLSLINHHPTYLPTTVAVAAVAATFSWLELVDFTYKCDRQTRPSNTANVDLRCLRERERETYSTETFGLEQMTVDAVQFPPATCPAAVHVAYQPTTHTSTNYTH